MDKKWILLGMVFLLSLVIGSVGAAELESHDFGDYFTMDVPKGTDFSNQTIISAENGTTQVVAVFMGGDLEIVYLNSTKDFDKNATDHFKVIFEAIYPMNLNHKGPEGDLIIFEADDDGDTYPVVVKTSGNELVYVIGDDLNLVKEMANTIKFD